MAGVAEGCISDIEANWDLITNPEQLMNIVSQIYILAHPYLYTEETRLICEQIYTAAMSAKDYRTNADEDTKARLIGKAVGVIFTEAILFKGIGTASIALKASAEFGLLATWIGKIGRGEETAAGTATKFKTVAEALTKVENTLSKFRITSSVEKTAEEVNAWWRLRGYTDPYKANTIVKEITLAENTAFVRVYPEGGSMAGGWVMRAEEVQGLTAQQIMDKFALPSLPKYICDVELEAGTTIRCGIAGEQAAFGGAGGGVQFDLMQQFVGQFTNQRLIP